MLAPLVLLQAARGVLFPWVPVFLATGIAIWFALPFEPDAGGYLAAAAVLCGLALLYRYGPELAHPPLVALGAVVAGGLACGLRAALVVSPMLTAPYYGPVQGRVVEIDRSQSDALRLTLDQVVLAGLSPDDSPRRVRISLHGAVPGPEPGQVVILTARLAAPEGPAEPDAFDFRRMAFFQQLGAVGYSRSPVLLWENPARGAQVINRLRSRLSAAIMAAVPGDAGAFASGVMTGDRSGISLATVTALRDSNLAHLLAISGMNMAFLTGFVFMLLRYGIALLPVLALRVNAKKLAAVAGFAVALFYLLLSGANVATERAFLMVTVMLGAVLADRRALTLRSAALAGLALLLAQPESLLSPGFQLSFAATVALIAGFGPFERWLQGGAMPGWLRPPVMLILSSVLAGAATAPFAAAHFNRFTDYGLLANLLTVPVMSILMGAGALAALLAPLGLADLPLWVMTQAARWILAVAHWIAGLHGAVTPVPAPGPWVLPLIGLGGAGLVLWRGRGRLAALPLLAMAALLWHQAERPLALISADGRLVGLLGPAGRALSSARGAGFAAETWLEEDGDLADQALAASRPGFTGPAKARRFDLAGRRGLLLRGNAPFADSGCAGADLVIIPGPLANETARNGCLVIDSTLLHRSGALAVMQRGDRLELVPTRRVWRIWMAAQPVIAPITLPPQDQ